MVNTVNAYNYLSPSTLFMIILWPFGFANGHELLVAVICLDVAELLSLMVTIYSSYTLECSPSSSAVSGSITIKIMPHGR